MQTVTDDLAYIAQPLRHLAIAIDTLILDPANARKHDEKNLGAIKGSLTRFGQRFPIIVQKQGNIVRAGNGRVMAAKAIGWSHIAALVVDESDVEAVAFAIADNRSAELAEWDDEALAKLLESLPDDAFVATGFSDSDLKDLLDKLAPEVVEEDDTPAVQAIAVSRPGDLWLLGEHRLLSGDSTKAADVGRVMDGQKAALCQTDPPYLVDYTGERPDHDGGNKGGKDWSATYKEVQIKDADGFFRAVFTNILSVIAPNAAVYCWHAHKRQALIARVWEDLSILDHQQVIWVKPTPVFGRVFWHFRHEPCMMGWVKGSAPAHDGDQSFNSVWEIDWGGKARIVGNEHPTQKPIEIFARPMRKHTASGDICFEPFSGSGSQIIAAEQLKRRCYAIELEPVFVDVAVRRWQAMTDSPAVLDGDGRTFEELAAERAPGDRAGVEGGS
jgi:DNA modification methylase